MTLPTPPDLSEVLPTALRLAFHKAAEKAIKTQTPLVVWQNGAIEYIASDAIAEYIKDSPLHHYISPESN